MKAAEEAVTQLPGFKISSSHFRIGSKIHISDFYYAKRFFQNSFFASRIAFILAQDIHSNVASKDLEDFQKNGLTLIGYGMYSELLLSMLEKFMRVKLKIRPDRINHNLVLDSEHLELVKQNELFNRILIVVPIASTFGTAVKIEESLLKKNSALIPVYPQINVLYISDTPQPELTLLEKEFGWEAKDLDKKTVDIRAYYEQGSVLKKQRYYIRLESNWHGIDQCPLCFPKKDGEKDLCAEIPLFETDRTSVTPTLIFNLPRGRWITIEDLKREYTLDESMVQYGHHTRNNSHFLFSIKTEKFLVDNHDKVNDWLELIRRPLHAQLQIRESDHILLVSSCHYSNADFIDLVNEKLFSSSASIIHYDPTNDYIQNFEMIYGHEIKNADKIIFADDALKSGANFSKIHEFIDYTLNQAGDAARCKGIAACLTLINIAQDFTVKAVGRKLFYSNAIYAFANLHLYTSLSHDDESPLLIEEKRYRTLVTDSFLDSMKTHFLRQCAKLATSEKDFDDRIKKSRHLNTLEVTHRIYQYFTLHPHAEFERQSFDEFRDALFDPGLIHRSFAKFADEKDSKFPTRDAAILKVLSQSPFVQYEPLRRKVFLWTIRLLDQHIEKMTTTIKEKKFDYGSFEMLKFLIRRAGLLNSNYLVSLRIFTFLELLYSENGISKLVAMTENYKATYAGKEDELSENEVTIANRKLENLNEFSVFYAAQIKELLLRNENRAAYLEDKLKSFKVKNAGLRQLIRILKDENCITIKKFYEFLEQQPQWDTLYTGKKIKEDYDPIVKLLNEIGATKHYRYIALQRFFEGFEKSKSEDYAPLSQNQHLLVYLWLIYFLVFDKDISRVSLEKKTEVIFRKIRELFLSQNPELSDFGAFFIVKSSSYRLPLPVYDRQANGTAVLDSFNWHTNNPLLLDFIQGTLDKSETYHKSVAEYAINPDIDPKQWQDMYAVTEDALETGLEPGMLPKNVNRLVLVRLNKRINAKKEKPQAVIGVYFRNTDDTGQITSINIIRYLQLLREPLSLFVETHHENNEFRDWQVAEATRKLMLLSGHGKEMLRNLSPDVRYLTIAEHLEYLQMIVLLNKSISDKGGLDDIKKRFNEFYHVQGEKMIDQDYLNDLHVLAQDIYARHEIEDKVPCQIPNIVAGGGFPFAFNCNILTLICFELIVNAKKNRWHFLPGQAFGGHTENRLSIVPEIITKVDGRRELKITITNLGPLMDDQEFLKLNNRNNNVKSGDAVAGTALLKALVFEFLGGSLHYNMLPLDRKAKLVDFQAILTLPEMQEHGS